MFVTGPKLRSDYREMGIPYEEVISRAQPIAEVARRNAAKAEQLRRIPEENVRAIIDSGLMPLLRPREFGGFEADWITHIDCVAEVARYCGSTGWVMSFLLQHQFYLAYFPVEAQRTVYERHPNPKIVTSFAPTGKVRVVPGGYELAGRWVFASGASHCDWAIVGGKAEIDGVVTPINFLLSPGQFKVDQTWNGIGLRGSGSDDLVIEDPVFVPGNFTYLQNEALIGRAPGSLVLSGRLYRGTLALNLGFGVMAAMHGIARGAFETFVSFTRGKSALMGSHASSEFAETQAAIGESKAEIDLAHLVTEKASATSFSDTPATYDDIVRTRRDFILIRKLLQSAIDRLFALSGARGLSEDLPLQRAWRDFHAISHHMTFAVPSLQTAGRIELGLGVAPGDFIPEKSQFTS